MILLLTFSSEDERQKFEYLYDRYKRLLLYKAHQVLGDYALAEDAVSEAYLRIYKNLHKIGEPDAPRSVAFMVTIARNAALTLLGQQSRHAAEAYNEVQADDFDLEGHILSALDTEAVYGLLNHLSEELRSAFVLKYAYDMSHKEIGKALGISENNVTVRVHRARKKLADLLVKEGYAVGRE